MFPQLDLRFDANSSSGNFGDIFDPGTYINAITGDLLQLLFRGGALLAEADRQSDTTATAAEEARAAVILTRSHYINGHSTIFDRINSQTTAAAAETRAIETRRARIENQINLHLALGSEPLSA
jgi:outer membrane protein TolC